jgi:hypothetical protein
MKTFKCDRCQSLYSPSIRYPNYILSKRIETEKGRINYQYIDLCPSCYSTLCEFIGEEIEEGSLRP